MKIPSFIRNWQFDRSHFPIRWLSYKQRIALDIERVFKDPDAKEKLGPSFIDKLSISVGKIEEWVLKLYSFQIAITAFFVVGFISDKPTIWPAPGFVDTRLS